MKFAKELETIRSDLPDEYKKNVIDYKTMKKAINQIVKILDKTGLYELQNSYNLIFDSSVNEKLENEIKKNFNKDKIVIDEKNLSELLFNSRSIPSKAVEEEAKAKANSPQVLSNEKDTALMDDLKYNGIEEEMDKDQLKLLYYINKCKTNGKPDNNLLLNHYQIVYALQEIPNTEGQKTLQSSLVIYITKMDSNYDNLKTILGDLTNQDSKADNMAENQSETNDDPKDQKSTTINKELNNKLITELDKNQQKKITKERIISLFKDVNYKPIQNVKVINSNEPVTKDRIEQKITNKNNTQYSWEIPIYSYYSYSISSPSQQEKESDVFEESNHDSKLSRNEKERLQLDTSFAKDQMNDGALEKSNRSPMKRRHSISSLSSSSSTTINIGSPNSLTPINKQDNDTQINSPETSFDDDHWTDEDDEEEEGVIIGSKKIIEAENFDDYPTTTYAPKRTTAISKSPKGRHGFNKKIFFLKRKRNKSSSKKRCDLDLEDLERKLRDCDIESYHSSSDDASTHSGSSEDLFELDEEELNQISRNKETETSLAKGKSSNNHSGRTKNKQIKIEIFLDSDAKFLNELSTSLMNLSNFQAKCKILINNNMRQISSMLLKVSSANKVDTYPWREIFNLYVTTNVWWDKGKERNYQQALETFQTFQRRAKSITHKFKIRESHNIFAQFVQLNMEIITMKRFYDVNQTAVYKILKKHDKRTKLSVSEGLPYFISGNFFSDNVCRTLTYDIVNRLLSVIPNPEDYACPICQEIAYKPIRLNCGHLFCLRCLIKSQRQEIHNCPICRSPNAVRNATSRNLDKKLLKALMIEFPKEIKEKKKAAEMECAKEEADAIFRYAGFKNPECTIL